MLRRISSIRASIVEAVPLSCAIASRRLRLFLNKHLTIIGLQGHTRITKLETGVELVHIWSLPIDTNTSSCDFSIVTA